jgi:hypothetical protein
VPLTDVLSGATGFAESVVNKTLDLVVEVEEHSRIRLLLQIACDMAVPNEVEFDDRAADEGDSLG